jgi:endonuclease/exonuclease/phosphatase family metal-dependent hydrolase
LRIDGKTRSLVLFNCHLGLAAFERRMQLRRFVDSDQVKHTRKSTPFIICGDFNDVWGNLGRQILESANFRLVAKSTKTFPAILPVRPLDRICCRGDIEIKHSFASRTKITRQASDHLPLVADF